LGNDFFNWYLQNLFFGPVNFLNVIVLLGAVQGFIISSLLFFHKTKSLSNRILAFLILIISLACLNLYFLEIELPQLSEFWYKFSLVIPLILAMPMGPLVFFYVRALIQPNIPFEKKDRIHFYPVILDLLPRITGAFYLIGHSAGWIADQDISTWIRFVDYCDMFIDIPRWLSASVYTILAWRILKTQKVQKTDASSAKWAKQFVYGFAGFQFIWLLHLIPYVTPLLSDELIRVFNWYPIYIPLAIMVYWLGINGYLLRATGRPESKNVLPPQIVEDTKKALNLCMEKDKLYLNPALSLNTLVEHTGISQKIISSVLNQHIGKSFNEYVNDYRIETVKQKLGNGQNHLTITGIAFECGFNSQATFQRVFKQTTGLTPTEFLAQKITKTA
jgi:AraC-like DNA-binding protein